MSVSKQTVTCANGHSRTVTVDQLGILDHWIQQPDEELQTGTG